MKCCLSIAGSDCSGGAGIQADIKTFSAHGCFGMSAITAVVAENTCRVISILDVPPEIIKDQIAAVFEDIEVHAVKIGMLSKSGTMRVIADTLKEYKPQITVTDPVMIAKGGCALMEASALEALKSEIVPLAYLLTPNIPEAIAITGKEVKTIGDMREAAAIIYDMGAKNVLIKGGHLEGEPVDILFDGKNYFDFCGERIESKNTHGTGCTLSSAIAANLANGLSLCDAVSNAKSYVADAIRHSFDIGKGHGPTNHFYELYKIKGIK